ncbi:MAG: porin family protein [Proteobacteria bacterium]|nr:porin family protein [Pseudomonadota bacterium]
MVVRIAVGGVFIIACAGVAVGAAAAADMRANTAPYAAPAPFGTYSWMGPYVGVNLGYQRGRATSTGADPNGFAGGLQIGYNWQTGQWVYGVEADVQGSSAGDTFAAFKFSNPWFGTARGRVGYAFSNVLVYATGGLAFGGSDIKFAGVSESNVHIGWAAGLGVEVGLARSWSAKAEYLFVDLAKTGFTITGTRTGLESSLLRLGVNYRF